jgi:hypothetical protein
VIRRGQSKVGGDAAAIPLILVGETGLKRPVAEEKGNRLHPHRDLVLPGRIKAAVDRGLHLCHPYPQEASPEVDSS